MSQSHLVIDFPIAAPADAKALTEELPPVMPDFAKAQDDLGTVHFSRFMVEGEEKLLFLSDIDGEVDQHIERLVERAGPVFDAIFEHVDDPPATPVSGDPERVGKWLKHHVREPSYTYFAYEDASVQDIKAAASAAGFTSNTAQSTLLTYMSIKSRLQGFALKLAARSIKDNAYEMNDAVGTLHFLTGSSFRRTTWASSRSTMVTGTSTFRTSSKIRHSPSIPSSRTSMAHHRLRSHRTPTRSISGHWRPTTRPSGSTAPIPASGCKTSEPCWPMQVSHHRRPLGRRRSRLCRNWIARRGGVRSHGGDDRNHR